MSNEATRPLVRQIEQTSGNAFDLKLVQQDSVAETKAIPAAPQKARLEFADDLDELWDNVPI